MTKQLELPESPVDAMMYYQETLVRRLVRLLVLPTTENLNGPLRSRAISWAFFDCLDAGIGGKATMAVQAILGRDVAARQPALAVVAVKPPPPRICDCGHMDQDHDFDNGGICMDLMYSGGDEYRCRCPGFAERNDGAGGAYA